MTPTTQPSQANQHSHESQAIQQLQATPTTQGSQVC